MHPSGTLLLAVAFTAAGLAQTTYRFDSAERMPVEPYSGGTVWNYGVAAGVNGAGSHGPEIWRWTHDLGFERFTCELPGASGCSLAAVSPAPDGSVVVMGRTNWLDNGGFVESFVARYQSGREPQFRRLGTERPDLMTVAADNSIWLMGWRHGLTVQFKAGFYDYALWQLKPDFRDAGSAHTVQLKGSLGLISPFIARGGHLWLVTHGERAVVDLSETGSVLATYPLSSNMSGQLAISRGGEVAFGTWLLNPATQKWRPLGVEGSAIGYDGDRLVTIAYGDILFHQPAR